MKKVQKYFTIVIVFFDVIFFSSCTKIPKEQSLVPTDLPKPVVLIEKEIDEVPTSEGAFHEVSLPNLMQKKFDGRDLEIVQALAQESTYTRYQIQYKSGSLNISGIMNVPKGSGPFPVAILNHGHIDTSLYTNGRGLKREQDYLARNGFVVIHSDYRNHAFSDKAVNPDLGLRIGYAEDVINVIYAAKNSQFDFIDKNNFVMLGHSMGGGVAINIMVTQGNLVKAYVLFAPVSADFRDNFERWTTRRPETAGEIIEMYGDFNKASDFWKNVNAYNFLDNIQSPIMIHHGTSDESVPLEWSERLFQSLQAKSKDATLHIYQGEPHEFINAWPQVMVRTLEFFRNSLVN